MIERIKAPPAPEVVKYSTLRAAEQSRRDFPHMCAINKAHGVMLVQQGILSRETGARVLRGAVAIEAAGIEHLQVDPKIGDLYLNLEHQLIQRVGPDGGRLHMGRSRNDLGATIGRTAAREALFPTLDAALQLRRALLTVASQHTRTVMPGYTHLQPAQPTTLGHYLTGVAMALERDCARLREAYGRLNLSPLGAAAFAGTGFPINRELTASLLGFDGVLEHTQDAVASRDYVPEVLAGLALLSTTCSRLAQDIYTWDSDEFAYVEIADEVAGSSSIMPQKKNPSTLEAVKGKAGHALGALVSALAAQKNTGFMHTGDVARESAGYFWEALEEVEALCHLLRVTVATLQVKPERMLERAATDFCTVTELADTMVREKGLPFRTAHRIVGPPVALALQRGLRADGMDAGLLDESARAITGQPLELPDQQIRDALEPLRNVEGKRHGGGPAPTETERLIRGARRALDRDRRWLLGRQRRLEEARATLDREVAALIGGGGA